MPLQNVIFVTGGAGFIGSAVIRLLLDQSTAEVVNIDCLTYAGNLETLVAQAAHPRYHFEQVDICNADAMRRLLRQYRPRAILHLAAETHVDRSIDSADRFIQTNVVGTHTLLHAAREYLAAFSRPEAVGFRFHQVSTDEVFGSLGAHGRVTEDAPCRPNSPYAASKAASDHLVRAWHATFGLPVVLSHCSNNYGPYQHPEKLVPTIISKALADQPIPLYGDGRHVRDWLYVADHANALVAVLEQGRVGCSYNIGANQEYTNLQVAETVCRILDQRRPAADGAAYANLIEFVADRPGHDYRYALDAGRIRDELGWAPADSFDSGIRKTVEWYLAQPDWLRAIGAKDRANGRRLGLPAAPVDGRTERMGQAGR